MNEQAILDSYNLFVQNGYSKSLQEYKALIASNQEALQDSYNLFASNGYTKSVDEFKGLMGLNQPIKKKEQENLPTKDMESPLAVGSLDSQKTEEQDYFTGAFGDVLRGLDNIIPIGIGDFVDDMARSVAAGYRQGTSAQRADKLLLQGTKATPEQIQRFINANKNAQSLGQSAEMQDYQKIYEGEGKGFWGVVKGLANNPSIIPEVLTSSITAMATNTDALTAGAAAVGTGTAYGAGTGALAGGVGAAPGAVAGAIASVPYAFGLASSVVEMGSTFGELLQEELKGKEMTKENVKSILENPEKLNNIRNKAIARGAIIGTVDAFTGKLASGVGAKIISKSAAKSATGGVTRGAATAATAAGSAIEGAGGSLGEAVARGAIGQEMDVSEIALEGIGELPGGIRSTIQARLAKPSYKVNGETVSAEQVDKIINTMSPTDLAKTKIEIKNDYEGREFKIQDKIVTNTIREEVRQVNPDIDEERLNKIVDLEKQLQKVEGNKTQSGKDKAAEIRSQIKEMQEGIAAVEETPKTLESELREAFNYERYEKMLNSENEWEREMGKEFLSDPKAHFEKYIQIAEKNLERDPNNTISKNVLANNTENLRIFNEITNKYKQENVQKQAAGEVPVQSGAGVSQEVAQGEPQAELKITPQEIVQEEIIPEVITEEVVTPEVITEPESLIDTDFDEDGDLTDEGFAKAETSLKSIIEEEARNNGIPLDILLKHYNINSRGEYFSSTQPILQVSESNNYQRVIKTLKDIAFKMFPDKIDELNEQINSYSQDFLDSYQRGDEGIVLDKSHGKLISALDNINNRFNQFTSPKKATQAEVVQEEVAPVDNFTELINTAKVTDGLNLEDGQDGTYSDKYVNGQIRINGNDVEILDWNSNYSGRGNTQKSLQILKNKYGGKITAIDVGYEGEESYSYWQKMLDKGLIDGFYDDNSILHTEKTQEVAPAVEEVTTVEEVAPVAEAVLEVEQYEPITETQVSHEKKFNKNTATDYEEDTRETDSGREVTYLSRVTVEALDDNTGDAIGGLVKIVDEDKNVSWQAVDLDGNDLGKQDFDSLEEAKTALVKNWNKVQKKEFDKEAKRKAKEAAKKAKKTYETLPTKRVQPESGVVQPKAKAETKPTGLAVPSKPSTKREEVKGSIQRIANAGLLRSAETGKPAITEQEIDVQMALTDAMASVWEQTTGKNNFYETFISDVKEGDVEAIKQKGGALFQNTEVPQRPISRVTLGVFEEPLFQNMKGAMVAPQSISDFMKSKGKQIEKEIINNVLSYDKYKGQKRISFDEFRDDVETQIMKLERIDSKSYSDYGMDNLGDNHNYGKDQTIIFNSPIDHGQYGHFRGDFTKGQLNDVTWEVRQIPNTEQYVAIDADMPPGTPSNQIAQYVGTAGSLEEVNKWVSDRTSASLDAQINKGLFGHIRNWFNQNTGVYTLAELQSDYFQKNKANDLYASKISQDEVNEYVNKNFRRKLDNETTESIKKEFGIVVDYTTNTNGDTVATATIKNNPNIPSDYILARNTYSASYVPVSGFTLEDVSENQTVVEALRTLAASVGLFKNTDVAARRREIVNEYEAKRLALKAEENKYIAKRIEEIKKSEPASLMMSQFIASQKVHELRLFRESLKHAADKGATELWFPTPYTIAVIEGYVSSNGNAPYEVINGDESQLSPGDTIEYGGTEMTVVESSGFSITVAPSDEVSIYDIDSLRDDETNGRMDELEYNLRRQVGNINTITREQVEEYDTDLFLSEQVKTSFIEWFDNNPEEEYVTWSEIEDEVRDYVADYYYDMSVEDLVSWASEIYMEGDVVYAVENRRSTERLGQPSEYESNVDEDDFEGDLSEEQYTVVKKYEELGKMIRKMRPDAEVVTDNNGKRWLKTAITKADASNPIIAFQEEGGKIKGAVDFSNDNKASIYIFDGADISTLAHEMSGHIGRRFLEQLSMVNEKFASDYEYAKKWAGVKDNQWSRAAEEKWARGFEKYLRTGKAPNAKLKDVFEKLRTWLTNIYKTIKGSSIDIKLTPEITRVFDNLLTTKTTEKKTKLAKDETVRPQPTGDRTGRTESSTIAPLEGAPSVPGVNGPDPQLVAVAEQYAKDNGIPFKRQAEYVKVDEKRAKRIADAYEAMANDPQNPKVKESYQNLIKQTIAQYKALEDAGYKFWFMDLNIPSNAEYASTPYNAIRDLRKNKEMGVFPTTDGYGDGGLTEIDVENNPMLADTGLKWSVGGPGGEMKTVLANDLFRAVHDAFGHGLEGAGFRARGEENAWQAHVRLFTGSAIGAITSETRGQNSWLNYGPNGEQNKTAKVEDTVFAEQKVGLMPKWTWTEGKAADMEEKQPPKPKAKTVVEEEAGPTAEDLSSIEAMLDLDMDNEDNMLSVLNALDKVDNAISKRLRGGANDALLALPLSTVQLVVKTLKALVKGGMMLRDAIKKVATDNNISQQLVKDILNISEIQDGFNELMDKVGAMIDRQTRRGTPEARMISNIDTLVRNSEVYQNANDAQKKILEREARAKAGAPARRAPSIGRILGVLKDITNVSREDKLKIISQIRQLSKDAAKDLANEIKEMASSGKITAIQQANIISRFARVNVLNELSVSKFVDYMANVFANAEYANQIDVAKSKLKTAKKNIATKIGIADGLALPLQRLFSIKPTLIPTEFLERYLELVNMFSEKQAVLSLEEKSKVTKDVEAILSKINEEQSLVDELSDRFNSFKDKVVDKDGNLDYNATIEAMLKDGVIDEKEAASMKKNKSSIVPREGKEKKTDEEIAKEKQELITVLKDTKVSVDGLNTQDERNLAERLVKLVSSDAVNKLGNNELKNLLKVLDNINNNYLPHYAQLMVEKLTAINNAKTLTSAIQKAVVAPLSGMYSRIKSLITRKGAISEMIRRNPLFNIDQLFGDYKTKDIFNAILNKAAEGESMFIKQVKTVQNILERAEEKVAKSFKLDTNKTLMSKFKMMTYLIQLEYDSNQNSKQVNPSAEYLKATIKHIDEGKSQFGERDANMLQEILDKYTDKDGNIDNDKLYNSFNQAEKEAIKAIRDINESLKEKAEYTASIIRGDRINPLTNYVHLNVLHEHQPNDATSGVAFVNDYNDSMRPSTKAKSLIERTGKVSPLNFDVFASAQRGAKFVLMDYNLTEPIRTARKTLNQTIANFEESGRIPKEKREIINAIQSAFEEVVDNVLTNSFVTTSIADDVVDYINKQGYRSVLAGTGRFASELMSNIGFALIADPKAFASGIENRGVVMSSDAPIIMENVGSKQVNRIFPTDTLSGKLIDTNILQQASGVKGAKSKNPVANKIQQIWNLSGKKYVNAVELTADALISTPDKLIMRPMWFGSFANEFKKISGEKINFEKIASKDEAYMNKHKDAIEKAKNIADEKSVMTGSTENPFMGILKGTVKPNQSALLKAFNNFNNFMTKFLIFEFVTARTAVNAAIGNGSLTKKQGIALLGAVTTRMVVYTLLTQMLGSGLVGLVYGDEEEEDEKSFWQKLGQAFTSAFTSMIFGRDFGNATKTLVNYGLERANEEYLDFLREGEYDPYKDAIQFSIVPPEKKGKQRDLGDFLLNMGGAFGPTLKTADLITRKAFEEDKKEKDAIERQKKEINVRIPLEVLGNAGLVPLYKDVRKSVLKDIYKDLEKAESRGSRNQMGKEDMKKYFPDMYNELYGPGGTLYDVELMKKQMNKEKEKIKREIKDEMYNYTPK